MRKLLFVLLAFIAVFTYISALDKQETEEKPLASVEILSDINAASMKISVENNH